MFRQLSLLCAGLTAALSVLLTVPPARAQNTPEAVPGRLLVRFRPGAAAEEVRQALRVTGARIVGDMPQIGVRVLQLPVGASETAAAHAFGARAGVEFAEPDRILPAQDLTPNDPWYLNQWHLKKIAAPTAWSCTTGSSSIIIAILDSGVDATHPDLGPKVVAGWNCYNNSSDTRDVTGHGTAVAGAAAACSNNSQGVASPAWNCRVMPIRVSDLNGNAAYSTLAAGLTWAADHGARVANISYVASESPTVTTAAQYFQSKGGVVTASAGNYGTYSTAADNPYILTVSATDGSDNLCTWSNTGMNIDLAAPGSAYTTLRGGSYSSVSGTSISAPIVAGVAALVLSVNASLTPAKVQEILKLSADDRGAAGWDTSYGWGRVNAARAVANAGGTATAPPPSTTTDTTAPTVRITAPSAGARIKNTVSVTVSATDNVGVKKVELYVDGRLQSTSTASPYTTTWNARYAATGAHALTCRAYDAAGNVGVSASVTVYR